MGKAHRDVVQRMLLSRSMRSVWRPSKDALHGDRHTEKIIKVDEMLPAWELWGGCSQDVMRLGWGCKEGGLGEGGRTAVPTHSC